MSRIEEEIYQEGSTVYVQLYGCSLITQSDLRLIKFEDDNSFKTKQNWLFKKELSVINKFILTVYNKDKLRPTLNKHGRKVLKMTSILRRILSTLLTICSDTIAKNIYSVCLF